MTLAHNIITKRKRDIAKGGNSAIWGVRNLTQLRDTQLLGKYFDPLAIRGTMTCFLLYANIHVQGFF